MEGCKNDMFESEHDKVVVDLMEQVEEQAWALLVRKLSAGTSADISDACKIVAVMSGVSLV